MLESLNLHYFFGALVSLLVITNPPSKIPLFMSLTIGMDLEKRRSQANWAALYSCIVMLVSLAAGNMLLAFFGISYGALRIAGGLVIAMIGQQMLFGGSSPNKAPQVKENREDYAFFPLAMPGIAGPGTIAVVIGFSTEIAEQPVGLSMVMAFVMTALAIIATSLVAWATMRSSEFAARRMGSAGLQVLTKCMGFVLVCIGVQFVGSGIRAFMAGG